jgi:uracil phosphoribosyltransferase
LIAPTNGSSLDAPEYCFKAPEDLADRVVLVLNPVLATGTSAIAAVDRLKEHDAKSLRVVSMLAAPEGIAKFRSHHPDVHVWTAAIDERLNERGYIVPGIGDVGDRMYGTK